MIGSGPNGLMATLTLARASVLPSVVESTPLADAARLRRRGCREQSDPIRQPPTATAAPDAEKNVREVVERFGERLKNVSLLAPADHVRDAVRREYGELVTSDLLQRWLADPAHAPGRLKFLVASPEFSRRWGVGYAKAVESGSKVLLLQRLAKP